MGGYEEVLNYSRHSGIVKQITLFPKLLPLTARKPRKLKAWLPISPKQLKGHATSWDKIVVCFFLLYQKEESFKQFGVGFKNFSNLLN